MTAIAQRRHKECGALTSMHVLRSVVVALAVLAGSSAPGAAAPTGGTTALQLCGTLKEHRASTPGGAGSVTIGTRTYAVAPGTLAGNGGVEIAVGRDLCVTGSVDRASGELVRYLFFPFPPDAQFCGTVVSSSAGGFGIRADFGVLTLALRPGNFLSGGVTRVCYTVEVVRPSGDLTAVRSQPVDTKNEREWVTHCGTVKLYSPATAAAPGAIGVGSSSWRIAKATSYTGDPAGDRTDRTAVGSNMCLSATLGDAGEIIEYATRAMTAEVGGTAAEYTPPSGDRPAIVVLSYRSHYTLKVPAAIASAVDLGRGHYCYSIGVDASGDAIATALIPCQVGVATGPAATESPAVTAASATPGSSSGATGTTRALPSTSSGAGSSAVPLIAAALVALVLAGPFVARRRALAARRRTHRR